ncbi:MAG: hypothetical protein HWN81_20705, partial [Candidatus Lokiarchaeota archaeon]|nr:hypothetical protein [Candidatus Lokiarchaeota archaeon]
MTEKKDNFILKWNDDSGQFAPIESDADMNEGIFIELVNEEKWRHFYIKGASLISRRTALRAANGISKTGYIHPKTNVRYGVECELKEEISPYEDMPNNLRKS